MQNTLTVSEFIIKELEQSNSYKIVNYDDSEEEQVQYSYERINAIKLKVQMARDKNVKKLQRVMKKNIKLVENINN